MRFPVLDPDSLSYPTFHNKTLQHSLESATQNRQFTWANLLHLKQITYQRKGKRFFFYNLEVTDQNLHFSQREKEKCLKISTFASQTSQRVSRNFRYKLLSRVSLICLMGGENRVTLRKTSRRKERTVRLRKWSRTANDPHIGPQMIPTIK